MHKKICNICQKLPRKIKKFYRQIFSYNAIKYNFSLKNHYWQTRKKNNNYEFEPNDFQIERAKLLNIYINNNDIILDIGSGDGSQLTAISKICPNIEIIGSDKDKYACELMKKNNFKCFFLKNDDFIFDLIKEYSPSCVTLFEVLEHMESPEELIIRLLNFSNLKIFASVPNSGYFVHRTRYLFGRFPIQWIANPNEHLRFWTLKDLNWWINYLDIKRETIIIPYKGIPFLNKFFPNLFAKGLFLVIKK